MKKHFAALILASSMFAVPAFADKGATLEGTLVKIDGSYYVVKGSDGKEHRFHFDDTTKKEGDVKEGGKVEIYAQGEHTTKIEAKK